MGIGNILRDNIVELSSRTTNINGLLAHLYQSRIISAEDRDEIENSYTNPTGFAKSKKIYKFLIQKEDLFTEDQLKKLFLDTSNEHLVQIIWNNEIKDSCNSDSSVNMETLFIVKSKHLHDIVGILSNYTDLRPRWYMLAPKLISDSEWRIIRNKEDFMVRIFQTLKCWVFWNGKNATFDKLLRVVEKYNQNAKDELLDKFKQTQSYEEIRRNLELPSETKEFWNVPERNINFTTRSEIFKNLESKIKFEDVQNSTCKIILISMGGCGKSSIATEFLYKYEEKFSNIFWLSAENASQITSQYIQIGQKLKFIREGKKDDELYVKTLIEEWFENPINSNWILVYDNAEGQNEITNLIPRKGGFVIITSRNRLWNNVHKIEFEGFSPAESIEFIGKNWNPQSHMNPLQYANIPKELGYMPLAIAIAIDCINSHSLSPSEYLDLLENYTKDMLEYNAEGLDKSIYISMKISLDKIAKVNHHAYQWLEICSYMRPDRIDRLYLEQFIKDKGLSKMDQSNVQKIILQYGIVKYNSNEGYFVIHRLVQKSIQIQAENIEKINFQCAKFIFERGENHQDSTDYSVYDDTIHLLKCIIPYATKMCQKQCDNSSELKLQSLKKLNALINKLVMAVYMPDIGPNLYADYFKLISKILVEPNDSHILHFNMGRQLIKKFQESVQSFEASIDIVEKHHVYALKALIQIIQEAIHNGDYQKVVKYTAKFILIHIHNTEKVTEKYEKIFVNFVKFLVIHFKIPIFGGFDEKKKNKEMLEIIEECGKITAYGYWHDNSKWLNLESQAYNLVLNWLQNYPSLCNQIMEEIEKDSAGEEELNIFLHKDLPEYDTDKIF